MAAFYNQLSLFPNAARRDAVLVTRRGAISWSALLEVSSNVLRQGAEIVFFLWMFVVLAFLLLVAAGFVI